MRRATGRGGVLATSYNGSTSKTLKTELGEVGVDMPRDRNSSFEPLIVEKGQTHWDGFDDKIDLDVRRRDDCRGDPYAS